MTPRATSDNEVRAGVVEAAVAITGRRRFVPNQICRTCMTQCYAEQHRAAQPHHDIVSLTRAESDAVWAAHKAANDADWAAVNKHRRI